MIPSSTATSINATGLRVVVAPTTATLGAGASGRAVAAEEIRLEFKRGAIGVSVTWRISAAADCAK